MNGLSPEQAVEVGILLSAVLSTCVVSVVSHVLGKRRDDTTVSWHHVLVSVGVVGFLGMSAWLLRLRSPSSEELDLIFPSLLLYAYLYVVKLDPASLFTIDENPYGVPRRFQESFDMGRIIRRIIYGALGAFLLTITLSTALYGW